MDQTGASTSRTGEHDPSVLRAISLLRTSWVLPFVFGVDPLGDVRTLTSAGGLHHAFAGEHFAVLEEEAAAGGGGGGPSAKLREAEGTTQWVVVPAFNAGGLRAGYLITRAKSGRRRGTGGGALNAFYRVIRDDRAGQFLTLCDMPEHNLVQFASLHLLSASTRARHYCVARRDALVAALRAADAPGGDAVARCLTSRFAAREHRFCPTCAVPAACTCPLPAAPLPSHGKDFAYCSRNLTAHCGSFFGSAVLQCGAPQRAFATQCSIAGGSEPGLTQKLINWAVQRRLVGFAPSPERPPMEAAGAALSVLGSRGGANIAHGVQGFSLEEIVDMLAESHQQAEANPKLPVLAPRGKIPVDLSSLEKDFQRKIQKRLAAQKNDKRRSENLKRLKESIAAEKSKVEELGKKKAVLAEENKTLREMVNMSRDSSDRQRSSIYDT